MPPFIIYAKSACYLHRLHNLLIRTIHHLCKVKYYTNLISKPYHNECAFASPFIVVYLTLQAQTPSPNIEIFEKRVYVFQLIFISLQSVYFNFLYVDTTLSTVKPKCSTTSSPLPDAPKRSIPMTAPFRPVYLCQP